MSSGVDGAADAADVIQPGSAAGKQAQLMSDLSDLISGL